MALPPQPTIPGRSPPTPPEDAEDQQLPSGHATAAFFGAALLSEGDALRPLYYVVAVIVATSRLHVRIHHASDVVGGVVLGAVLGRLVRALIPLDPDGDQQGGAPPSLATSLDTSANAQPDGTPAPRPGLESA